MDLQKSGPIAQHTICLLAVCTHHDCVFYMLRTYICYAVCVCEHCNCKYVDTQIFVHIYICWRSGIELLQVLNFRMHTTRRASTQHNILFHMYVVFVAVKFNR